MELWEKNGKLWERKKNLNEIIREKGKTKTKLRERENLNEIVRKRKKNKMCETKKLKLGER